MWLLWWACKTLVTAICPALLALSLHLFWWSQLPCPEKHYGQDHLARNWRLANSLWGAKEMNPANNVSALWSGSFPTEPSDETTGPGGIVTAKWVIALVDLAIYIFLMTDTFTFRSRSPRNLSYRYWQNTKSCMHKVILHTYVHTHPAGWMK